MVWEAEGFRCHSLKAHVYRPQCGGSRILAKQAGLGLSSSSSHGGSDRCEVARVALFTLDARQGSIFQARLPPAAPLRFCGNRPFLSSVYLYCSVWYPFRGELTYMERGQLMSPVRRAGVPGVLGRQDERPGLLYSRLRPATLLAFSCGNTLMPSLCVTPCTSPLTPPQGDSAVMKPNPICPTQVLFCVVSFIFHAVVTFLSNLSFHKQK